MLSDGCLILGSLWFDWLGGHLDVCLCFQGLCCLWDRDSCLLLSQGVVSGSPQEILLFKVALGWNCTARQSQQFKATSRDSFEGWYLLGTVLEYKL